MALVRDNCLVPTIDAPELGYAKESTNEQYVPDVFYAVSGQNSWTHHNIYFLVSSLCEIE